MKTIIAIFVFFNILISTHAVFAERVWTTEDFNLHCRGTFQVVSVDRVQPESANLATSKEYQVNALVSLKVLESSPGCARAQKQFGLIFSAEAGSLAHAKISEYGQMTDVELQKRIYVGSLVPFEFTQTYASALKNGELPFFPIYHKEHVSFAIKHVDLNYDLVVALSNSNFSGKFATGQAFIYSYPELGGVDPINLSSELKHLQIEKIIERAKSVNFDQDEAVEILDGALTMFRPSYSASLDDYRKFLELAIPTVDRATIKSTKLTKNTGTNELYRSMLNVLQNSFAPAFSNEIVDPKYSIEIMLRVPLIVQAHTGNGWLLKKDFVESFISNIKPLILSGTVSKQKILQLIATVEFIKAQNYKAIYAPDLPTNAKSNQMIEEILNLK